MSNPYNPYATQQQPKFPGYGQPNTQKSWSPREVEFGDVFNYSFEIWKNNIGLLLAVVVIRLVVYIVFWGVEWAIAIAMTQQGVPSLGDWLSFATSMISYSVDLFLGLGVTQICLKLARGQQAEIGDLFGGGSVYLPTLGMSVLVGLVMIVAYSACVIPGIFLTLFVWPFFYFIADRQTNAIESIEAAIAISRPNLLPSFLMMLTSIALAVIGVLALGVGIVFTSSLTAMMYSVAYLMMSSQLLPPQRY